MRTGDEREMGWAGSHPLPIPETEELYRAALVSLGEGVIVLEAQAPGEKALQVVQNVLGGHLARFGERAGLAVTWSPAAPVA